MSTQPVVTLRLGAAGAGARLVTLRAALAGTTLEVRTVTEDDGKAVIKLDEADCGSVAELRAFISVCEHRWGVSRAPLARSKLLRRGQAAMRMLVRFQAAAVLEALHEAVSKDAPDSIACLGLASTVRFEPPVEETRGSDGTPTGRWFTDASGVRTIGGHKSPPTLRRVVHPRQPTSRDAQQAGALALLRAWVAEDEAATPRGPAAGLLPPSSTTAELAEYERLLGRAASLRANGKLDEERKLLKNLDGMYNGGWLLRQTQTREAWEADVDRAEPLEPLPLSSARGGGGGGTSRGSAHHHHQQQPKGRGRSGGTAGRGGAGRGGAKEFVPSDASLRDLSLPRAMALVRERLSDVPGARPSSHASQRSTRRRGSGGGGGGGRSGASQAAEEDEDPFARLLARVSCHGSSGIGSLSNSAAAGGWPSGCRVGRLTSTPTGSPTREGEGRSGGDGGAVTGAENGVRNGAGSARGGGGSGSGSGRRGGRDHATSARAPAAAEEPPMEPSLEPSFETPTQGDLLNMAKARRQRNRARGGSAAGALLAGQTPAAAGHAAGVLGAPGALAAPPAAVGKESKRDTYPRAVAVSEAAGNSAGRDGGASAAAHHAAATEQAGVAAGAAKAAKATSRRTTVKPQAATDNQSAPPAPLVETESLLGHSGGLVRSFARSATHAPQRRPSSGGAGVGGSRVASRAPPHAHGHAQVVVGAKHATPSRPTSGDSSVIPALALDGAFKALSVAASAPRGAPVDVLVDAVRRELPQAASAQAASAAKTAAALAASKRAEAAARGRVDGISSSTVLPDSGLFEKYVPHGMFESLDVGRRHIGEN